MWADGLGITWADELGIVWADGLTNESTFYPKSTPKSQ